MLDLKGVSALISFPSLPGATALLLAAATRGLGAWRCPFLAFNLWVRVPDLRDRGRMAGCAAIVVASALYPALRRRALEPERSVEQAGALAAT